MTLAITLAVLAGIGWAIRDAHSVAAREHGEMVDRMERERWAYRPGSRWGEEYARLRREIAVDPHPIGHVTRSTHFTDTTDLARKLTREGAER